MPQTPPPAAPPWQVLAEEIEFETPFMRARRQKCRTQRGAIVDPYHVFDMPNWAAILAVTPDMRAVLVRNYRHGAQRSVVELPGGLIDDADMDSQSAAARELLEETGHSVAAIHALPPIHPYPGRFRQQAFPYLGVGAVKTATQALEPDEDLDVFTVPLADAFRLFSDGSVDVAAVHAGIMLAALHTIIRTPALADLRRALPADMAW